MADAPDMLDAFQDWMRKRGGLGAGSMPERVFFAGWLTALRAATSSPVADDALPALPEPDVNELEPFGPPTAYSAEKVRQAQREAYEAGRRKGWLDGAGDAAEMVAEAQPPVPSDSAAQPRPWEQRLRLCPTNDERWACLESEIAEWRDWAGRRAAPQPPEKDSA